MPTEYYGTRRGRELQLCSQQVSETRNRLNGVKLLVPVIADRECDDVVACTPREGFARGDWGEICRKSVLSHPRLPVRMPVAARESRPVHGRTLSPFRTLPAGSHPLRTAAARIPSPRSPPLRVYRIVGFLRSPPSRVPRRSSHNVILYTHITHVYILYIQYIHTHVQCIYIYMYSICMCAVSIIIIILCHAVHNSGT